MLRAFTNFLKKRLRRKLNVFLVCLFISSVIWLLIALSKSYTSELRFPVQHEELPKDRIPSGELPEELHLELHSHGFQLLSYHLFSKEEPVKLDLSKLHYKDPEERTKGYLPTAELVEELTQQFPEKTRVEKVRPDTFFIEMTERVEKEVEVVPELELEFREQYRLDEEVEAEPSRVKLSGPASILDSVERIHTLPLQLEDLHEDHKERIGLRTDSLSERIAAEPSEVELRISVDEFTEGATKVGLNAKKVPEGYTVKTYPDSITVHYLVAFGNYEKVKREMFEAMVELPSRETLKEKEELSVRLTDHPSFVEIVRYEPRRVEFIIREAE